MKEVEESGRREGGKERVERQPEGEGGEVRWSLEGEESGIERGV